MRRLTRLLVVVHRHISVPLREVIDFPGTEQRRHDFARPAGGAEYILPMQTGIMLD